MIACVSNLYQYFTSLFLGKFFLISYSREIILYVRLISCYSKSIRQVSPICETLLHVLVFLLEIIWYK